MKTAVYPYKNPYHDEIREASELLRGGGLVVFPTETVYGLGANALLPDAVNRIFGAKGRPADNPLIVHLAEASMLEMAARDIPPQAYRLFECFAPGPLSIVLPKRLEIPDTVTGGLDTVAVRIPAHPMARELIALAGVPVAAPSANRSGRPSPTGFAAACAEMDGLADCILDGGDCEIGIESTVAALDNGRIVILRPGAVTAEMIKNRLHIEVAGAPDSPDAPRSPGTKYAHYKPDAEVIVAPRMNDGLLFGWMERLAGKTLGILRLFPEVMTDDSTAIRARLEKLSAHEASTGCRVIERAFYSFEEYARELYRSFAELDGMGADRIVAEAVETNGLGRAIMDRLGKASGGKIIERIF
ncbi:MAG: threonylcarbamoyl-AMP synthase [Spirochaetes bacterium GWF1_51_8]|nr:MAG: threonylcarbamoyl-AMP synthase [Spirochaetes bacterium GWF1_51_8]